MVLGNKWPFFPLLFLGNIGQGNVFYDILEQKKRLSYLQKQELQKVQKIDTFPKVLTHGFGPKITIFPTFLFRQYRQGKCLLRYSRIKKTTF